MKSVLRNIRITKNTLFFWGLIWLSISGGVLAFVNPADLPIVFAQTTGQFSDTLEYEDGTTSIQVNEEYILDFDGVLKPQIIFEDETKIIIESNSAPSLVYDKNSCAYTLFDKGYIDEQNSVQIPSVSWVTRTAELNTDNWVILDELDNQPCSVELKQEPRGWSIWATKELNGNSVTLQTISGELETDEETIFLDGMERPLFPFEFDFNGNGVIDEDEIIQDKIGWKFYSYGIETESIGTKLKQEQILYYSNDVGIKESVKIFNNDPTLRNNKFAFTQTVHTDDVLTFGDQSFDIASLVGITLDRDWILENQAEIFQVTEKLNYDFSVGIEDIWVISFYEHNDGYKIALDYANVGQTHTPIDGIYELDPTININESGGVYSFGALPAHSIVQSGSLDATALTPQEIIDIQNAIDTAGTYPATQPSLLYENGYVLSTNTYTYAPWNISGASGYTDPAQTDMPYLAGQGYAFNSGPSPARSFEIKSAHPIYNQPITELTVPMVSQYTCAGYYTTGPQSNSGASRIYVNGDNYDTLKTFTVSGYASAGVNDQGFYNNPTGSNLLNCLDIAYANGVPNANYPLNFSTYRMTFNPPIYLTNSDYQHLGFTDNFSNYYGAPWFYSVIPSSNGLNGINDPNRNGYCTYHWSGSVGQGTTNAGPYGACSSGSRTDTGTWNYGATRSAQEPLMAVNYQGSYPVLTLNYIVAVAPDAPQNFALSYDQPNNTIDLTWDAPANDGGKPITGYRIEVSNDNVNFTTETTTTGLSHSITNLTYSLTYYYKMVAINDVGDSVYTSTLSQEIGIPPDPPTGLTTTIQNPDANPLDIYLQWSSPAYVGTGTLTGFEIWRDGALITTTGLVTSYTDTVPSSGTYSYQVKAVSTHGTSGFSNSSNQTTPTVPNAITDLLATVDSDTQISLSWSAPTNGGSAITGYKVFQDGVQIATPTSASYVVTGLTSNTQYTFKVIAVNNVGDSADSNLVTPTTYLAVSGSINVSSTVQGASVKFDFVANVTGGTPTPNFNTFTLKEGATVLASNISTPYYYALPDISTHNYTISSTDNAHWNTPTISGTASNIVAGYAPNWENSVSYNYTRSTNNLSLFVNQDRQGLWDLTCSYRTTAEIIAKSNGVNGTMTNDWYYSDAQSISDADTVYVECSDVTGIILSFTSYNTNRIGAGISLLDNVFSEWTGTPVALVFVLLVAGLFSGRSAPAGILLVLAIVGVMGFIGLLVIDELIWAFILLAGILGLFMGKRFL